MRACHGFTAAFDDQNLVSCTGLAPVLQLGERAGLQRLVAEHVHLGKPGGVNPHLKIPALVAGMVAGADSIEDMALLRHGAMKRLFTGVRATSTRGTFLRSFTFGHVRQLDAVASRLLINLAGQAPLLPGAVELAYVDIDDTLKQTYGYAKQGAGRGYTGVKGLNALLAVVSTPSSAPLIAAARLRQGSANSARGASRFVTDRLVTARKAGATGVLVLRASSAYYGHDVLAAARRKGARFSVTARQDKAVRAAIAGIAADAWTTIKYTDAVFDEQQQRWISDADVAEITYTAFTSKPKAKQVTARLIVRRVTDMNPNNQSELFTVYRYHAVFTDSPLSMLAAERAHRAHAIIEQVIADLRTGSWRTCPPGTSGPTAPGWSAPRSPSTSPGPPAPWPRPSTPKPPPARSAPSSSPSRAGSPAPPDASPCPYRCTGPASTPGDNSPPQPQPTSDGLTRPPVHPSTGTDRNNVEINRPARQSGAPA